MEEIPPAVKKVRPWRRIPELTIPIIPAPGSVPGSASQPQSPVTPVTPASTTSTSTQPRLRVPKRTKWEKVDDVLTTFGFESVGEFLATLFHNHRRGEPDPRTPTHRIAVTRFLNGVSAFKMADIIELIYDHPQSRPKQKYPDQVEAAFSHTRPLDEIRYARPCLNSWATRIVGNEVYRRVGLLAKKTDDPESRTHVRATTNERTENANVATWEDTEFSVQGLADKYQERDPFIWYMTECFCAPRVKGEVVMRKRRPHPVIQVGALSAFIVSRNPYASGDLALPLGIWHFACKSHVDVKRVYCRFGSTISDRTARKALNSMSATSLANLQHNVRDATARDESEYGKVLDNVQQFVPVYEHGLGRDNQLKVGIACTAFRYDNAKPGAFNAADHIARVIAAKRQDMTTETVFQSIDWSHIGGVTILHFVRVLAEFTPHLDYLRKEISDRFRTSHALHRIAVSKKVLQPLATNAERELSDSESPVLGSRRRRFARHSYGTKRILATLEDNYESMRNVISTPETWHTKATDLNSCASNHYGPAASKDPSSLSRSSNAANMKRPADLKKCDFYPTSRSMTLIWEARVLDCWRHVLGIESDIHAHFEELAAHDILPSLEDLLEQGTILRERYASQPAYDRSLDKHEHESAPSRSKIPSGSPWTPPCAAEKDSAPQAETDADTDMPGLAEIPDDSADPAETDMDAVAEAPAEEAPKTNTTTDGPKVHQEEPGFDGDRVASNAILFLMEFGWWVELNYAIPEGDVGRVLEILKIFIFTFAGTSNQNYMRYMLDLYSLLEFECSPDLKEALLNNYLFNLRDELGNFVEGDLTQEWYNRWLEDMVSRRGGDFDDKFYRQTISPNVHHFLKIKEDIESAFDLKRRSKSHTSPHLRDETKVLLQLYKEEELHLFRPGRSMGLVQGVRCEAAH
ncbi:hypothetical protein B0H13DRAFT_2399024 [Mycena leptocephala]|nr:hypothetical protein B0H13DRAFT_2399024 [Mycena leptocephala]